MSPNLNDIFPSKFLKAHDLQGREPIVTIDRVELESVGQKREVVPVAYFVGKEKGLRLNKTMGQKLMEISGSAITEEWHGVKVKLYAAEAAYGGDTYDVIRIKSANGASRMSRMTPIAPPPKPKPEPDVYDDDLHTAEIDESDIPF